MTQIGAEMDTGHTDWQGIGRRWGGSVIPESTTVAYSVKHFYTVAVEVNYPDVGLGLEREKRRKGESGLSATLSFFPPSRSQSYFASVKRQVD